MIEERRGPGTVPLAKAALVTAALVVLVILMLVTSWLVMPVPGSSAGTGSGTGPEEARGRAQGRAAVVVDARPYPDGSLSLSLDITDAPGRPGRGPRTANILLDRANALGRWQAGDDGVRVTLSWGTRWRLARNWQVRVTASDARGVRGVLRLRSGAVRVTRAFDARVAAMGGDADLQR